jgi:hypothetical protein
MDNVIESWGRVRGSLGATQSKSWLRLADEALKGGGVLSLDPRDPDHAAHIEAKLGDDSHLAAYFPRKADMLKATSAAFELHGGPPERTLLQMTPQEAGFDQLRPYVGVPHFAFHPTANAVVATGVVSHPDILHALELVLEVVDADTGELVGATSIPPQFGTNYQRTTVTAPLGDAKPRRLVAGLTTNYVVDGKPHANPSMAAAALNDTDVITQVTPFAPLPIKHPTAKQVTITIKRSDPDADYNYPNVPNPAEIVVPFSGQAQLATGYAVNNPPCQTGSLVLIARSGGTLPAGARYSLATSDVIAAFAASEGAVATWSMGPDWQQQFGQAAGTGMFDIQLQATLNVKIGGTGSATQLTVSTFGPVSPGGTLLPLNIMWGCVAPWTRVRMADGSERPIAAIVAGDLLLADASGRVVEVDRVITGEQTDPMWRLVAGGREVLATPDHPVMTPGGAVAIAALNVGDEVATIAGPVPIERIAEEAYQGEVVNVVLRVPGGAIPAQGDCFCGGGLVIGDNTMQNALAAIGETVELPAEWQIDAANAARQAAGLPLVAAG